MRTLGDWIKRYIDLGMRPIPVFPPSLGCRCSRPSRRCLAGEGSCHGKAPVIEHWADEAPSSISDRYPEHFNVALAMGQQPDGRWLVAIDVDGRPDMPFVLASPPPTMSAMTGTGRHYIYEVPADSPLGNWNAIYKTPLLSVDVKYCRGAVVAPPSRHRSGRMYEWADERKPVMLPSWHVQRLIDLHRLAYPNVKQWKRWSEHPDHKGKRA